MHNATAIAAAATDTPAYAAAQSRVLDSWFAAANRELVAVGLLEGKVGPRLRFKCLWCDLVHCGWFTAVPTIAQVQSGSRSVICISLGRVAAGIGVVPCEVLEFSCSAPVT